MVVQTIRNCQAYLKNWGKITNLLDEKQLRWLELSEMGQEIRVDLFCILVV